MTDKEVLKKIIEGYISDSLQSPEVQLVALRAENARLRAALEWYANPGNYLWEKPGKWSEASALTGRYWITDEGDCARAALSGAPGQ